MVKHKFNSANYSKNNLYLKVFAIVCISFLLLLATELINGILTERETMQAQAIQEVSAKWGDEQTIQGPFISIPYIIYSNNSTIADSNAKISQSIEYLHILPEKLIITTNITPEKRYRNIYEVVVYTSEFLVSGYFEDMNFSALGIPQENILFDKAEFIVGINDLRGLKKEFGLSWNNNRFPFNPGLSNTDIVKSGIKAVIPFSNAENGKRRFQFSLHLRGSQRLYFTPLGKETSVRTTSFWQTPSFNGAFLPDERLQLEDKYMAEWNILHLNRNYPQFWIGSRYNVQESAFGIDLIVPVDNYQKTYRAIRYAILLIGCTFLIFFFVEILHNIFIHPFQYILVGFSLVIFFLLLLSISEHSNYQTAFIISAAGSLILVSGYVRAIMKSTKVVAFISVTLLFLYLFIFILTQLEDYALLIGSIGIFVILALALFFSRKIDWYNLQIPNNADSASSQLITKQKETDEEPALD